jgi:hypothetical protein
MPPGQLVGPFVDRFAEPDPLQCPARNLLALGDAYAADRQSEG